MWQPTNVIQAVADAELGDMVGPVTDFLGVPHFVELVARTTPEEGAWEEEWEAQKEGILQQQRFAMQQERLEDYLMHLRAQGNWTLDEAIFAQLMATSAPEPAETPDTEAPLELPPLELELTDPPVDDAGAEPVDAPAADAPAAEAPAADAPAVDAPAVDGGDDAVSDPTSESPSE